MGLRILMSGDHIMAYTTIINKNNLIKEEIELILVKRLGKP